MYETTTRLIQVSTELAQIDEACVSQILNKNYFVYKASLPLKVKDKFGSLNDASYHAYTIFRENFGTSVLANFGNGNRIVSPVKIADCSLSSFVEPQEPISYSLEGETILDPNLKEHSSPFFEIFYQSIRNSLKIQGFGLRGNTAVDERIDLLEDTQRRSVDPFVRRIAPFMHLRPAIRFSVREFDGRWFLQLSPKSVLEFEKDLFCLLNEWHLTASEISNHFEFVSLPIGRTGKLFGVLRKTVSDPINEKPFDGASFLQFAEKMYKSLKFDKPNAELILVIPLGNRARPWYFSSELTRPSIRFPDLAHLDHELFAKIQSKMKIYSAQRIEVAPNYVRSLRLNFLDEAITFAGMHTLETPVTPLQPSEFDKGRIPSSFTFPDPWISFRNRVTGQIIEVNKRTTGHNGAPQDLMKYHDLACVEAPEKVNLKVICEESLYRDVFDLLHALVSQTEKYRGFNLIFSSRLAYSEIETVPDLASPSSVYEDIDPSKHDCTLIFGPRRVAEDSSKTRQIYTYPETQSMNRGVPSQYIANEPSDNPNYDLSLQTKSLSPNTLFGIGLNILGKVGARPFTLGKSTTDRFLPNSAVIGYNIVRIFKPITLDISQEESPRELVRSSTPLAAPVVLMSGKGDEIIQQVAFELPDQISLFKGSRGSSIMSTLMGKCQYVLVHKDGPFYQEELNDLSALQQNGFTIIPVSIISDLSPRMFSSFEGMNQLPIPGMVLRMSSSEFLMCTPLVTRYYDAMKRGWPNTILIRIHDEILSAPLTEQQKIRILYQIWSLTRAHMGSQIPTRMPISIHYSNLMGEFLRKVGDPEPSYFRHFAGTLNRIGFVPKPFL